MSETCPNCGSAKDEFNTSSVYTEYICRYGTDGDEEWTSETCDLIRGLREELSAARDAERDRIADYADGIAKIHRSKALAATNERSIRAYITTAEAYERAAMAFRNNEHRSEA